MAEEERIAQLEADLVAARKVIATLIQRVEKQFRADKPSQLSVLKAFANLESVVEHRTRELAESQSRYRALYDHSPDMLLTVNDSDRITTANRKSHDDLGMDCLLGTLLTELFTEQSRPLVSQALSSQFEPGDGFEVELTDGRIMFMVAAKIPGFSGSTQVGLRDITARRQLETQLGHARRLAELGHVAAGVAHEINNPLSVLQLGIELLLENDELSTSAGQLRIIHEHSLRIARIVQNLQSFAQPRSDEREIFPVLDVIASAIKLASVPDTIAVHVDTEPLLNIKADHGRVEQVLVNLLSNACAALQDEGEIRIAAKPHGGFASITVCDNGPGVPKDLLEHIFTPFVSGRLRSGSGLGLAIAWSIVKEHGGSIKVTNLQNGGAAFEFSIPQGRPDRATPRGVAGNIEHPTSSKRFLVVDDEVELLEVIAAFIRMSGEHDVVTTSTAEEALDLLSRDSDFDAVLSDIRLPEMQGPEFVETLQRDHPELAERTVLMSGFFNKNPSNRRYLQKPFGRADLWRALKAVLG